MITILSSPKPFRGNDKINQYNAISSWKKINNAEIILYGDEEGIDEAGDELHVKIFKDVKKSSYGIPLFNSIILHADKTGRYDIQMYINCDIILNDTIFLALNSISFNRFLLIGERMDLSEGYGIDTFHSDYRQEILKLIYDNRISFHGPHGIDYFIFRKGIWDSLPDIIVGRGGYDSALIAHCLRNKIPIIDGTGTIIALHQYHNYNHVKGDFKTVFYGEDAIINNKAQGGKYAGNWISDSDYYIDNNKLIRWKCRGEKLRSLELFLRHNLNFKTGAFLVRIIRRIIIMGPLLPPKVNSRILNSLKKDK